MAAVYSFGGDFIPVVVGFTLFAFGYRLAQLKKYQSQGSIVSYLRRTRSELTGNQLLRMLVRYTVVGIGVVLLSAGGFIGAQAILDPQIELMILSGVLMTGGFITGLSGINNVFV